MPLLYCSDLWQIKVRFDFRKQMPPPATSHQDEGREDELDWNNGLQEVEKQEVCFTYRYHRCV